VKTVAGVPHYMKQKSICSQRAEWLGPTTVLPAKLFMPFEGAEHDLANGYLEIMDGKERAHF
jgi:hypothetical protein